MKTYITDPTLFEAKLLANLIAYDYKQFRIVFPRCELLVIRDSYLACVLMQNEAGTILESHIVHICDLPSTLDELIEAYQDRIVA